MSSCKQGVVGLHLMLWIVDGLPFTKILFSLACHAVYSTNLSNFPYISLVSIPFLSSVGKQSSHKIPIRRSICVKMVV